jgi:hypothetical protein
MKISKNLIATLTLSVPLFCVARADSGQKPEKEIPTVSYCDLLRDPAKYDKMTVRLTALYTRGFEISALDDPKCNSQKSTWVEFDPASRQCTKDDRVTQRRASACAQRLLQHRMQPTRFAARAADAGVRPRKATTT